MSPLFAGIIAAATGYEQLHTLICRRPGIDQTLDSADDRIVDLGVSTTYRRCARRALSNELLNLCPWLRRQDN
jgi:hypothetical protein